ncbi:MAG: hypothetical protein DSZ24_03155 [Thermodesulfatator sp.]|nr:MAG: hypothetical protein DSZ24_03155 [Thermodesulfatator sp.]
MHRNLIGLILAGGLSRRFGKEKALALLKGKPLALWVKEALEPFCREIWLSLRSPEQPETRLKPHFNRVLYDPLREAGPLGGILGGLKALPPAEALIVAPCDQPLLQPALIEGLLRNFLKSTSLAGLCLGASGDYHPFPAIYRKELARDLERYLASGRRSVKGWLARLSGPSLLGIPPERWYVWDPEGLSFLNVNEREELKRLEILLRTPLLGCIPLKH